MTLSVLIREIRGLPFCIHSWSFVLISGQYPICRRQINPCLSVWSVACLCRRQTNPWL